MGDELDLERLRGAGRSLLAFRFVHHSLELPELESKMDESRERCFYNTKQLIGFLTRFYSHFRNIIVRYIGGGGGKGTVVHDQRKCHHRCKDHGDVPFWAGDVALEKLAHGFQDL